jgi:hypothetical protein
MLEIGFKRSTRSADWIEVLDGFVGLLATLRNLNFVPVLGTRGERAITNLRGRQAGSASTALASRTSLRTVAGDAKAVRRAAMIDGYRRMQLRGIYGLML